MMNVRHLHLLGALVCVMGMGAASPALSLTQSGPFGATPIAYTKTDWSSTLDFPKFNPSLGILVQVDLFVSAGITTTLTVTNDASSPSIGNAKTHELVTVSDPLSLLSLMPEMYTAPFGYSLGAGESITSGGLSKSASDSGSYTAPAILAEFVGPGTISMPVSTFTETVLANNGGNTSASQTTYANATGTVTYWYAVPEPSSLMALVTMVGLAGAAVLRRR